MKKTLLLLLFVSGLLSVSAQNIPNGDFENWEIRDHFKLDKWDSPTRNVEQTTDAKVGNYALKLKNTYIEGSNGYRSYVRNINNNLEDFNGFSFTGDPLSLVFWSKHDIAAGDQARIYAIFKYKGSTRGLVDFRFTGNTNDEFVKYSVPITWYGARTPDTVLLYLYSYTDNKVDGDGYVIFDDIHFEKIGERMDDFTNYDFEEWTNIGVEYPTDWRTFDLLYYEKYTTFLSKRTNTKITGEDAYIGDYALKIENYYSGRARYSYHYTGEEDNDSYTPVFPVNDTFKYLQGYYKYIPEGNDTARIMYRTFEEGASRSYDNIYLPEAQEWTFFTMPINYYSSTAVPDSATILIYSSFTDSIEGTNTALYLDGLELVMKPHSVSINELSENLFIYPNPAVSQVTVVAQENITLQIFNPLGELIQNQKLLAGTNIVNLKNEASGIYYFQFTSSTNQWTTKIIKQ